MADLNGINNTPFDATHLGALSYRTSTLGEGTIDRISITDSTGQFASFSPQFGGTPGADQVDYFSFLNSGLASVEVSFNAAQTGTYANYLVAIPITGIRTVEGMPVAVWTGGPHADVETVYNTAMEETVSELMSELQKGRFQIEANFVNTTWATNPASADAVWILDGSPVVIEIFGMQMDGIFGNTQFFRIDMSDVDYELTITPLDLAYTSPARDGLMFTDLFGISETHNGLTGIDRYFFDGRMEDLSLTAISEGTILAAHLSLPNAADTLVNVERIVAENGTVAFDVDGKAGKTYRLYEAAFDRDPDAPGLGFWIDHYDNDNVDLVQMAELFMTSHEFARLYGAADTLDDEAFLTVLYANVLDRTPDDLGFAFWRDQQDKGLSRAEMLQYFSESTENYANTIGQIDDGIYFV